MINLRDLWRGEKRMRYAHAFFTYSAPLISGLRERRWLIPKVHRVAHQATSYWLIVKVAQPRAISSDEVKQTRHGNTSPLPAFLPGRKKPPRDLCTL